ncbi:MAG: fused MFS/spermidine synthase [Actinomycetota bacterium]|nr:fused MFS/spermidine synthase [Actinomycetota bacterium]
MTKTETTQPLTSNRALPLLFSATLFVSSALLFVVQPMFAKMVLPTLGGSPATWIGCMLFFQAALLVAYAYAHWSTRRLGSRRQAAVHAALLLVPVVSLPITLPRGWGSPAERPMWWLLSVLVIAVGLPFLAVATTAPLLQRWFASTDHAHARDPYFLYRASNLGSVLALVSYPALIEPRLRLGLQGRFWAAGYAILVVLVLFCAVGLWRSSAPATTVDSHDEPGDELPEQGGGPAPGPPTARRRLRWVAWSFLPSSLMLGVTTYITTDIAAVPLLWVIPLALYLLTFVTAFSRSSRPWFGLVVILHPLVLLELVFLVILGVTEPVGLLVALNLVVLFLTGLVCHGQLARDRPPARHLTEFYLWVAVGGVLGGMFNALLAPLIFDSVAEYPLALVLAAFLRPAPAGAKDARFNSLDLELPLLLGAAAVLALWVGCRTGASEVALKATVFGAGLLACLTFTGRRVRLGLGVAILVLLATLPAGRRSTATLFRERTFFGVVHVVDDRSAGLHRLVHGNTTHGAQSTDPARRREPLTYFSRSGPIGQALTELPGREARSRVAVVGLGAGSLACYGEAGQRWTFYELDPTVARVARDSRLFTFLRDCPPVTDVVLGDARLSLTREPQHRFQILVVDAFNSDAIPVHLLTREALALYMDKLTDDGVLAVHITNRYLDLRPVLAALADDAGLTALVRDDIDLSAPERAAGKSASVWVVAARRPAHLGRLVDDRRWQPLEPSAERSVWTDDFSNIVSVFG